MPQPKIRPNPQDETQARHKPCAAQYGGQSERCDQQHQHGCTTGDKGHAGIGQQKQAEWLFQISVVLHFINLMNRNLTVHGYSAAMCSRCKSDAQSLARTQLPWVPFMQYLHKETCGLAIDGQIGQGL
jgi:hypothetical protein